MSVSLTRLDGMSDEQPRAFISYVNEDSAHVDRLCRILENAGIPYWRDRKDLGPGDEWKAKIGQAIKSGSFVFLACFSSSYHDKQKSTMNEEIWHAIGEYKLLQPGQTWIIPVRFEDVPIPAFELRTGLLLDGLNYVNLYGDAYAEGAVSLTSTIMHLLGQPAGDPSVIRASVAEANATDRGDLLRRQTKEWLPDPARRIDLAGLIEDETNRVLTSLRDPEQFPVRLDSDIRGDALTTAVVEQLKSLWALSQPFCETLEAAVRWGDSISMASWRAALQAFAQEAETVPYRNGGLPALVRARHLPVIAGAMTIALAGVRSQRWDNVKDLLAEPTIFGRTGPLRTPIEVSWPWAAFDGDVLINALAWESESSGRYVAQEVAKGLVNGRVQKRGAPVADWLFSLLRPIFGGGLFDEGVYARDFDRAEVMLGIIADDQVLQRRADAVAPQWLPTGRWHGRASTRFESYYGSPSPMAEIEAEARSQGAMWAPVRGGLFGGDPDRAKLAIVTYRTKFDRLVEDSF